MFDLSILIIQLMYKVDYVSAFGVCLKKVAILCKTGKQGNVT